MEIADKPLSKKKQGRIPYWHGSYEITKIPQGTIVQVELYHFKISKGGVKVDQKYFTLVRKDVLDNPDLSLSAKGLYCLICYDLTKSLRRLLINKNTREKTINSSKEL